MNPSDSKKLEEVREQHRQNPKLLASKQALINALEYHLAEQDREIEQLRRVFKGVCIEAGERQEQLEKAEADMMVFLDAKQKIEAQWAEEYNKREKAEARAKELEEALRKIDIGDAYWLGEIARKVLAEKDKALPKFKDIIGLFVDKPEEEKG